MPGLDTIDEVDRQLKIQRCVIRRSRNESELKGARQTIDRLLDRRNWLSFRARAQRTPAEKK